MATKVLLARDSRNSIFRYFYTWIVSNRDCNVALGPARRMANGSLSLSLSFVPLSRAASRPFARVTRDFSEGLSNQPTVCINFIELGRVGNFVRLRCGRNARLFGTHPAPRDLCGSRRLFFFCALLAALERFLYAARERGVKSIFPPGKTYRARIRLSASSRHVPPGESVMVAKNARRPSRT